MWRLLRWCPEALFSPIPPWRAPAEAPLRCRLLGQWARLRGCSSHASFGRVQLHWCWSSSRGPPFPEPSEGISWKKLFEEPLVRSRSIEIDLWWGRSAGSGWRESAPLMSRFEAVTLQAFLVQHLKASRRGRWEWKACWCTSRPATRWTRWPGRGNVKRKSSTWRSPKLKFGFESPLAADWFGSWC